MGGGRLTVPRYEYRPLNDSQGRILGESGLVLACFVSSVHGPLLALAGEMAEAMLEYDGRPDRDPKIEALIPRLRPLVARAEGGAGPAQGMAQGIDPGPAP